MGNILISHQRESHMCLKYYKMELFIYYFYFSACHIYINKQQTEKIGPHRSMNQLNTRNYCSLTT